MEITVPYNLDLQARRFQLEILSKEEKNAVLVIHRRGGKTALAINKLIIEAFTNPGKLFWYIAPTYSQGKQIVWNNDMLFKHLPPELVAKRNENELTVVLKNGSRITVKGGDNPDSLRGADPYGVIMDECQDQKEETYRSVIQPVLAANGGWIWFIGTPKTKSFFYKMFVYAGEHRGWHRYNLSAEDSQIIPADELEEIKMNIPIDIYNNEYRALFSDDDAMVFRNIYQCLVGKYTDPKPRMTYQIGVDLAKKEDFTVLTVFNCNTQNVDYIERFNQIDYDFQVSKIEALARRFLSGNRPARLKVDATAIGTPIVDFLVKKGLNTDPINFTNQSKSDLIQNLILRFDKKDITIPQFQPLVNELEVFESKALPSGRISYGHPEGLHDDCVWSLALAIWQAPKLVIKPITKTFFPPKNNAKTLWKPIKKVESLMDLI